MVGSNVFNTLAILGVAALVTPLVVHQKLVRREVPITIGVAVVVVLLALDGSIGRWEGGLLFAGAFAYTAWAVVVERREPPEVEAEYVAEFEGLDVTSPRHWAVDVALLVGGLALLVLGARWLVDGAVEIAEELGLSELVIGLTVVAAGTSLPEAATSIVAGLRGQRDIAVGNVVGSNLFNLLAVLGLSGLVAPDGVVAPDSALRFDLPVLVGTAVLCLAIFFTDWTISRWEGGLLVGLYAAYLAHVVLDATDSGALDGFRTGAAAAIAVAAIALVVASVRAARSGGGAEDAEEAVPTGS